MSEQAIAELIEELSDVSDFQDDELLHCRNCQRAITSETFRIRVYGAHEHRFSNPAAQVYDVCCFEWAPGASICGQATDEHSWFTGYRWQFAHCEACEVHLGWYYEDGSDAFFGLIPDSLENVE